MTTTKPKPKAKAKAKPKAKPKPKAAAIKPPPQDDKITNNEGNSMSAPTQDAPATKPKPPAKRDYRITKKLVLDVTDAPSLLQQLQDIAGEDQGPVTVYAFVGTGKGINPPTAIKQYGAENDMAGDYELVAEPNITEFKNVKTAQKRDVSFG